MVSAVWSGCGRGVVSGCGEWVAGGVAGGEVILTGLLSFMVSVWSVGGGVVSGCGEWVSWSVATSYTWIFGLYGECCVEWVWQWVW